MAIGNFLATGSDSDRELLEQGRRMIAARGTWDAHVTDLVRNFMPSRSVTTEALRGGTPMTPGNKTMQYIVNSTPVWAADMGAAALFSFVTTPSTYWFIARAQQEHLNMNPEIRE